MTRDTSYGIIFFANRPRAKKKKLISEHQTRTRGRRKGGRARSKETENYFRETNRTLIPSRDGYCPRKIKESKRCARVSVEKREERNGARAATRRKIVFPRLLKYIINPPIIVLTALYFGRYFFLPSLRGRVYTISQIRSPPHEIVTHANGALTPARRI